MLSFHLPEVGGSTQHWGQRWRLWSPRDPGCSLVPQFLAVRSWACRFPSLTLHLSDQGPVCDNTIHSGQKRFPSHVKRSYLPKHQAWFWVVESVLATEPWALPSRSLGSRGKHAGRKVNRIINNSKWGCVPEETSRGGDDKGVAG